MPPNAGKRRCARPACRAWAMHGRETCSVHRGWSPTSGGSRSVATSETHGVDAATAASPAEGALNAPAPSLLGSLAAACAAPSAAGPRRPDGPPTDPTPSHGFVARPRHPDDLALIEQELHRLFEARRIFSAWVDSARSDPDGAGARLNPAQFLRAWNDSTTRVVQLVRARRELAMGDQGGFSGPWGALLAAVFDELEATLAVTHECDQSGPAPTGQGDK